MRRSSAGRSATPMKKIRVVEVLWLAFHYTIFAKKK
jgi:hypothetical protein